MRCDNQQTGGACDNSIHGGLLCAVQDIPVERPLAAAGVSPDNQPLVIPKLRHGRQQLQGSQSRRNCFSADDS